MPQANRVCQADSCIGTDAPILTKPAGSAEKSTLDKRRADPAANGGLGTGGLQGHLSDDRDNAGQPSERR